MAEVVLHPDPQSFPVGTTVKVKAKPATGGRAAGEPAGSTLSEPVVAEAGTLTVTGLSEGINYVGYALVGGVDRYLYFQVSTQASSRRTGAAWSALAERTSGEEYEPSAERETEVALQIHCISSAGASYTLVVGGVTIVSEGIVAGAGKPNAAGTVVTFCVPAGAKWKCTTAGEVATLKSSYKVL